MTEKTKILLLVSLTCLCNLILQGQNNHIDSLLRLIKNDKEDTNKVIHSVKLCRKYGSAANYDSALYFAKSGLELAKNLGFKKGIRLCYGSMGIVCDEIADYPRALEYFFEALKIDEQLNDVTGKAKRYGSLGIVYNHQGNYPMALEYGLKALKINEAIGKKEAQALTLGNVGLIYWRLHDYNKALNYLFKALKINESLGDKQGIARDLGNIGIIYSAEKDYEKALDVYLKAQKIYEELDAKKDISINLSNMGDLYRKKALRDPGGVDTLMKKALNCFMEALNISEKQGDKSGMAAQLANIGLVNLNMMKFNDSHSYLIRALVLSTEIGANYFVKQHYSMLSELYERSKIPLPDSTGGKLLNMEQMRLKSLYYFKRHIAIRDTLFSEENKKELVRKEMNFDFEKKEAQTKAEQDKKDAITKEELKQKEQQRNYFIAGFGMLALLSLFILRGYRQKQKANIVITEQKALVDAKQKEIVDSIHYAKRIQKALLPSEKYFDRTLARLNRNK